MRRTAIAVSQAGNQSRGKLLTDSTPHPGTAPASAGVCLDDGGEVVGAALRRWHDDDFTAPACDSRTIDPGSLADEPACR
jgi:hypothetical protein